MKLINKFCNIITIEIADFSNPYRNVIICCSSFLLKVLINEIYDITDIELKL